VERERRFLLAALPDGLSEPRSIVDRYLPGTALRLRKVTAQGEVSYKLGQKVRPVGNDPSTVKVTNIYLEPAEYELLAALPAEGVAKTRYDLSCPAGTFAVDQFHGHLEGLVLAEVELTGDSGHLQLPAFAIREVTADDRYSGGRLASATPKEIVELIGPARSAARRHDDEASARTDPHGTWVEWLG
jgi:CYTH domain-containing protein